MFFKTQEIQFEVAYSWEGCPELRGGGRFWVLCDWLGVGVRQSSMLGQRSVFPFKTCFSSTRASKRIVSKKDARRRESWVPGEERAVGKTPQSSGP